MKPLTGREVKELHRCSVKSAQTYRTMIAALPHTIFVLPGEPIKQLIERYQVIKQHKEQKAAK
jgi:hypothetical protein